MLSTKTGYSRDYNRKPYDGYTLTPNLYFPVSQTSDALPAKNQVLGVEVDGAFKAYSFSDLTKVGSVLQDSINGVKYTIEFDSANLSARIVDSSEPVIFITTYWFAWYAFHPDTKVYNSDN